MGPIIFTTHAVVKDGTELKTIEDYHEAIIFTGTWQECHHFMSRAQREMLAALEIQELTLTIEPISIGQILAELKLKQG